MNEQQARELLTRYRKGSCSDEESKVVEAWLEQELRLTEWETTPTDKISFGKQLKNRIDLAIDSKPESVKYLSRGGQQGANGTWLRFAIAASVLLCLAIGGYFFVSSPTRNQKLDAAQFKYIKPGGYRAVLTLSGGRQIVLNSAQNGLLATQGNTAVNKSGEGMVNYSAKADVNAAITPTYNTISTPRGGQYKVTLCDGSLVWLNAASSISFPTQFAGNTRTVSITGEAYFEVAHNKAKPFIVTAGGQTVKVLGTHFNINAYADEPEIRTTLLEGSVKLSKGDNQVFIKPGQQASLGLNAGQFTVSAADLEKAVAWTNGNFVFTRDNIQAIMRQISRWYNVDVVYQGSTAHKDFVGSVSRFENVAEVLNTLELTGTVHFKIEGRRITVIAN